MAVLLDPAAARERIARARWLFQIPAMLLVPVLALTSVSLFLHPPHGTSLIYQWASLFTAAAAWAVGAVYVWVYFRCKAALKVLQDEK